MREATSSLSCTEQRESCEYYQLSLPAGEEQTAPDSSSFPELPFLSSSCSSGSLDASPALHCRMLSRQPMDRYLTPQGMETEEKEIYSFLQERKKCICASLLFILSIPGLCLYPPILISQHWWLPPPASWQMSCRHLEKMAKLEPEVPQDTLESAVGSSHITKLCLIQTVSMLFTPQSHVSPCSSSQPH